MDSNPASLPVPNGYESVLEESSLSMYYSFNNTTDEKTLENGDISSDTSSSECTQLESRSTALLNKTATSPKEALFPKQIPGSLTSISSTPNKEAFKTDFHSDILACMEKSQGITKYSIAEEKEEPNNAEAFSGNKECVNKITNKVMILINSEEMGHGTEQKENVDCNASLQHFQSEKYSSAKQTIKPMRTDDSKVKVKRASLLPMKFQGARLTESNEASTQRKSLLPNFKVNNAAQSRRRTTFQGASDPKLSDILEAVEDVVKPAEIGIATANGDGIQKLTCSLKTMGILGRRTMCKNTASPARLKKIISVKTTLNNPAIISSKLKKNGEKIHIEKTKVYRQSFVPDYEQQKIKKPVACSKDFRQKSELDLHRKTPQISVKNNINKCKYCDKQFAIAKALHNHLHDHCLKIPITERRKLLATAEIMKKPTTTSSVTYRAKTMDERSSIRMSSMSSTDSINTHHKLAKLSTENVPTSSSVTNSAKKIPHSGIYRTPNKLACKTCNKKFVNLYFFAEHMRIHSPHAAPTIQKDQKI